MTNKASLDLKKYHLLEKIGTGLSGEVYMIKDIHTGKVYAAKIYDKLYMNQNNDIEKIKNDLQSDIEHVSRLNNLSMPKIIGYSPFDFKKRPIPVVITQYFKEGSIADMIDLENDGNPDERWDETRKLIILYGVASFMAFLHSHNIIHGDLKPENILLDNQLNPFVTDIYFPKIHHNDQNTHQPTKEEEFDLTTILSMHETVLYLPPEYFTNHEYTQAGDVYAFGMIAYEIMTKEKPFQFVDDKDIIKQVREGKRPEFKNMSFMSYQKLIERCWSDNPSKRPTFDQIMTQLKTDPSFITLLVDDDAFKAYDDFLFGATETMKKSADEGDKNAMHEYASALDAGDGIPKNSAEAARYYKKAAKAGHTKSMLAYAGMLREGRGVQADMKECSRYLKTAASKGDLQGMFEYAVVMDSGEGVPASPDESLQYFRTAADKGHPAAMYEYAMKLAAGSEEERAESLVYLKRAIEAGSADAMFAYAMRLKVGDGVQADKRRAADLLKRAADMGHAPSMYSYAMMRDYGHGVEADKKEAARYYKMAADEGHIEAMFDYAVSLFVGAGGAGPDKQEAARYYKMAADRGQKEAMYNYGAMLKTGDGIEANPQESARYLKMATS